MDLVTHSAIEIGWQDVSRIVAEEIEKVLGIVIPCKVNVMEEEFWNVEFVGYRLLIPKLCQLLQAIDADSQIWAEALSDEGRLDVKDIGMSTSERLVARHLNVTWKHLIIAEDSLWLVGVSGLPLSEPKENFDTLISILEQLIVWLRERRSL